MASLETTLSGELLRNHVLHPDFFRVVLTDCDHSLFAIQRTTGQGNCSQWYSGYWCCHRHSVSLLLPRLDPVELEVSAYLTSFLPRPSAPPDLFRAANESLNLSPVLFERFYPLEKGIFDGGYQFLDKPLPGIESLDLDGESSL